MSVHWPIIRRCLLSPLSVAVVDEQRTYRRGAILAAAFTLAEAIDQKCRSKTVGVLLPTSGLFPIAALAGWILGKTVVPLNYLLKPEELQYVVDDCETDTIVAVQPLLDYMGFTPKGPSLIRLEDVNFKTVPTPRWPATADDDDLAVLLYTSGTSGRPKGVMLSHGNLSANLAQIQEWIGFKKREVLLGVMPQFHTFGLTVMTLLPLTVGCKVVYAPRFVPPRIVRLFREHKPTAFIGIPSMFNALLSVKEAFAKDFESVKYAVAGGEPLSAAVADAFYERFGVRIAEGYGMTETSPVTNWCRPYEYRARSVGKALPRLDQRIVDIETGLEAPPGREGEVRMKGPNVMKGYFKLPEQTAAAFDERGYLRSGDIGKVDAEGHLYITGRLKEMLIIGGENVFPREIEEALNSHETVKDSGVVGIPDPMRGEIPVAFVEMKDGAAFDAVELTKWCRKRLAGYKVPGEIRRLDTLPRNPTGKVMRRELKKMVG